ncbi:hypothetical protein ABT357_25455 [Streptomyces albidoflavus]|uniref:hypothetical protein n=1 Tax=Streptomyces albidoflavus TaxID=1886 RepID=UPI00331A7CC2
MTEAWGVVIAALVAGVVAVAGSFIGLYVGRRQVQDEAQVEHEQWLRGQRQEVYVAILDAWDQAALGMDWVLGVVHEEAEGHTNPADGSYASEDAWGHLKEALEPTRVAMERIRLLGPSPVTAACGEAWEALNERRNALLRLVEAGTEDGRLAVHGAAMDRVATARNGFLALAQSVLGEAPTPAVRARRRRRQARLGA